MSHADLIKIQNLILTWFAGQTEPVSQEKVRSLCQAIHLSVLDTEVPPYCLYSYFYPLVRAGFIECGIERNRTVWELSKPAVFFHDFEGERYWIGIHLTEDLKNAIEYDLIEDDQTDQFEQHICTIRWISPISYEGKNLPVIHNPSILSILKAIPACSPDLFSQEKFDDIHSCKQFFNPDNSQWTDIGPKFGYPDGLYRKSNAVYSNRLYFHRGTTFSVGENVNDNFWSKAMSCIDHGHPTALYDGKLHRLEFLINPPIVLARLLFLSSMFLCFRVNTKTYFGITQEIFNELQRIFGQSIKEVES